MKVLIKIILALLAVGGVCYWAVGKCAQPAERAVDHLKKKIEKKRGE